MIKLALSQCLCWSHRLLRFAYFFYIVKLTVFLSSLLLFILFRSILRTVVLINKYCMLCLANCPVLDY